MREKLIEQQLIKSVKDIGGIALKILLPNRKVAFVEVKAPGKTLRPLQEKRKRQLEALGFLVFCLDHIEQIGGILSEIQST